MKYSTKPAAIILTSAIAVTSCASITVNRLPQPGNSYSAGYNVVMEFENVLNLPDRAKVVLDGTTVGVVERVAVASHQVDVTARLDPAVSVPSNIHAILQQATVLGDIYVALERPSTEAAAKPLGPGGIVPLSQTTSPPQLEDTIADMAEFIGSGSIQRIQNSVVGINRATPADQDAVRRMASQVTVDLSDLSNNIETVDIWLTGLSDTANVMAMHIPTYQRFFSHSGMVAFDRGLSFAAYTGTLLPSVGSIYAGGYWLLPLLNSLADTMGAVQRSKWSFEDEGPKWRRLFTDFFLPQDKYPAINITSIVGPDGRELSGNAQDVLRILGAMP